MIGQGCVGDVVLLCSMFGVYRRTLPQSLPGHMPLQKRKELEWYNWRRTENCVQHVNSEIQSGSHSLADT